MPYVDAGPDLWIQFGENVLFLEIQTLLIIIGKEFSFYLASLFNSPNNYPENTYYVLHVSDSLGVQLQIQYKLIWRAYFMSPIHLRLMMRVNDVFEIQGETSTSFSYGYLIDGEKRYITPT